MYNILNDYERKMKYFPRANLNFISRIQIGATPS